MLELPEAVVIAGQINETLPGKQILTAVANQTAHAFAWYTGDPACYNALLSGNTIGSATAYGGEVEIQAGDKVLVISNAPRYLGAGEKRPAKHQLLLEFVDETALSVTIQMWGCLFCYNPGESSGLVDDTRARQAPSPLSDAFDQAYFDGLFDEQTGKLSAKEFLATKQRIPGLGNGVLQDILWTARIHPRRKMASLPEDETGAMYRSLKTVLHEMAACGGRDTERDLFGCPGGYKTILSKNTVGKPCPACGAIIKKEPFMGGAIYFCPGCQPL
jgi:formamidopyrimidine-DNA glycosylase